MPESATHRRYFAAYPLALFAAWVAAWVVNLSLRSRIGWEIQADTIYWISLKLIVWILPAVLAIRRFTVNPAIVAVACGVAGLVRVLLS